MSRDWYKKVKEKVQDFPQKEIYSMINCTPQMFSKNPKNFKKNNLI
jgi:hypothetical protein